MPAPAVSNNPVTREHYAVQVGLSQSLATAASRIRLEPGSPEYLQALAALVSRYSMAAISLGHDYYLNARGHAGVTAPYRPPITEPWADVAITAYMRAVMEDSANLAADLTRTAQTLAVNAGTAQIFSSIEADPVRARWARVTRGAACSFCLMLATRGAVYRTEDTAHFRPHLTCHCDVEMAWSAQTYEPTAQIRSAQSLYANSVEDGMTTSERQNAFRRALYAERNTSG
jgi:hypothetical protein